ncbi:MAG: PrsW family intramembrane metalloprotease [Coprococcus sp.]
MSAFALRLAVLPSVLLLLFVVRRNKNSRDPMSLLVWLAVLGAVSTIPAVVVELVGGVLLYYMGLESGTAVYELVNCFFIVAMIEELGKFLGMLILTWKNKNFDHSYDGVIYGVCSSLGFATLENILYVFQGGIGLGILRAVTAIPLHCSCGVIMGYFYSKARENANKGEGAAGNMLIAYFSTMGIHGLYDFVLSIDDTSVILCILVLILSVVLMFLLISHAAKNDHIIAVNPIWVNPYNFRYIPMCGYNQPNMYGQNMQYNQPNVYGKWQNTFQPNAYGQANQYNNQQSGAAAASVWSAEWLWPAASVWSTEWLRSAAGAVQPAGQLYSTARTVQSAVKWLWSATAVRSAEWLQPADPVWPAVTAE